MSHAATFREETIYRPPSHGRRRIRLLRWSLMSSGVTVVIAAGLLYWLTGGRYATTEDAYVRANELTLSTDVSGMVADIPVHDGEAVKQGQILFRIDPLKFQIALRRAEANLAQTRLNLEGMQADYQSALREAAAMRAQVQEDQTNYDRFAVLVKQQAVSQQETDDARYRLMADRQAMNAAYMQTHAQLVRLEGEPDLPVQQMPAYCIAAAQVAEAQREYATRSCVHRTTALSPG